MKKTLLFTMLLTIAANITTFAQTVNIDLLNVKNTTGSGVIVDTSNLLTTLKIEQGVDFVYKTSRSGAALFAYYRLDCVSTSNGINPNNFDANSTSVLDVVGLAVLYNNSQVTYPSVSGTYLFDYEQGGSLGGASENRSFAIEIVPAGTLSNKNVKNSPEFSIAYNAGTLTVNSANTANVTGVSIVNVTGNTVYASSKFKKTIDVSNLANGMYILVVEENGTRTTKKFIIN